MIPDNIDCNIEEIRHCDYFLISSCPETCGYAEHILGLGVGESYERRIEENDRTGGGLV